MPIRKRRPQKALNKNFERLKKREAEENRTRSAGRLDSRFPEVGSLEMHMEFVNPQGHVVHSEHRNFQRNDMLDFAVACQGRCGNGRMDMESVVSQMIGNRQVLREAKGLCREILVAGSNETCNCELRCKITARYLPVAAPAG